MWKDHYPWVGDPWSGVVPRIFWAAAAPIFATNCSPTRPMGYLMDPPSSSVTAPGVWLYNFEANNIIYICSRLSACPPPDIPGIRLPKADCKSALRLCP